MVTSSKTPPNKSARSTVKTAVTTAVNPAVKSAGLKATNSPSPEPKLVTISDPVVSSPDLKKRELIDLVVARSGIKKKDAKPVVEAMLAVLGETIASGRELNLQPLGKLRINRSSDKGNGRVIICKLRQSLAATDRPKDPLAVVPDTL